MICVELRSLFAVVESAIDTVWLGITVFCLVYCSTFVIVDQVFAELFYVSKVLATTATLDHSEGRNLTFSGPRDTQRSITIVFANDLRRRRIQSFGPGDDIHSWALMAKGLSFKKLYIESRDSKIKSSGMPRSIILKRYQQFVCVYNF